jgi:cold-inducible RNA-binding protein
MKKEVLNMQNTKLYVGNLLYSVTSEEIEELFAGYGTVVDVRIIEGKGFGFVEMSSQEECENARESLDGNDFKGRTLRVAEARPQKPREGGGRGPGRGGGRGPGRGGGSNRGPGRGDRRGGFGGGEGRRY